MARLRKKFSSLKVKKEKTVHIPWPVEYKCQIKLFVKLLEKMKKSFDPDSHFGCEKLYYSFGRIIKECNNTINLLDEEYGKIRP